MINIINDYSFYFLFPNIFTAKTPAIAPEIPPNKISLSSDGLKDIEPFKIEKIKNARNEYNTPIKKPVISPISFIFLSDINVPNKTLIIFIIWLIGLIKSELISKNLSKKANTQMDTKDIDNAIKAPFITVLIKPLSPTL